MASISHKLLQTGARIPAIGLGTFQAKRAEVQTSVECALDVGYRHIDTAISYQNEANIGEVLSHHFRTGKLKRKDIFITSKIPPVYLDAKDVRPQVKNSLERLETKYLDMLLIHFPVGNVNKGDGNLTPMNKNGERCAIDVDYVETWKVMECLMKENEVKAIGLSNFNCQQMDTIMENAQIPPSNLQLECHAYLQQDKIRAYAVKHDIVLTGYAPLGSPARPATYFQVTDQKLLEDPVVQNIAGRLNCTPAQLLIKFVSELGVIPLPKTVSTNRILENYEAMQINIPEEEKEKLKQLNCGQKYFLFTWAKHMENFPHGEF